MKVIIDRFEGDIAVIELDGEVYSAPRALFPGCEEGDAVQITRLGKAAECGEGESPHSLFERLRRKSRKRKP